ncbi:FtsX-like permease family protein [bacterium]|nr:MAG: FtsX-like permease family protein [bacterium]
MDRPAPFPPSRTKRGVRARPLAAGTYLRRNAGKTLPLIGVIVLAVMLVAGIIAMINSIPYSIRTIYGYSREMTGVTPRGDATQTKPILDEIQKHSPVPVGRVVTCRATMTQIRSIVGKWPFYVLGLSKPDMEYYLDRQKVTGIVGRLPIDGKPEAIVSEPLARNLDLKIGSELLGPDKDESGFSPYSVKVVGIAQTDRWLAAVPVGYLRENHFPPVDLGMVFAKDSSQQDRLDRWTDKRFKGRRAAVLAYFQIEKNTQDMFKTLFLILDVIIGVMVLVMTTIMGMLINIYQTQRLQEFGLLAAIGYTKKQILRRVATESVMVVVLGWLLGLLLAYGLLLVAKATMMDPRAYAIDPLDPLAYSYTVPIPIAILIVAIGTVIHRFRNLDPIGIVERRLV